MVAEAELTVSELVELEDEEVDKYVSTEAVELLQEEDEL